MIEAACGILIEDGHVFLNLRPATSSFPDLWETVGGRVEEGESAGEAVVREFKEEVGLDVTVTDFILRFVVTPKDVPELPDAVLLHFFTVARLDLLAPIKPDPTASAGHRWVSAPNVEDYSPSMIYGNRLIMPIIEMLTYRSYK